MYKVCTESLSRSCVAFLPVLPPGGRCLRFSPGTALRSTACHTHRSQCSRSPGCNSPPPSSCQAGAACGCWRQHTNQTPHCCLQRQGYGERKERKRNMSPASPG